MSRVPCRRSVRASGREEWSVMAIESLYLRRRESIACSRAGRRPSSAERLPATPRRPRYDRALGPTDWRPSIPAGGRSWRRHGSLDGRARSSPRALRARGWRSWHRTSTTRCRSSLRRASAAHPGGPGGSRAEHRAGGDHPRAFAEHQPHHITRRRAQRHPHPEFGDALAVRYASTP